MPPGSDLNFYLFFRLTLAFSHYTLLSMQKETIHKLQEKFKRIVELANEADKAPRAYGTEYPMTNSEIHLIELIGDNGATLSVTDLAKITGVTKGAVSQTLKKLENKGFIIKQIDPSNLSRVIIDLTSRGKTAYYSHRDWHETMDGGVKKYFTGLSDEELDFLYKTLDTIETFFKKAVE